MIPNQMPPARAGMNPRIAALMGQRRQPVQPGKLPPSAAAETVPPQVVRPAPSVQGAQPVRPAQHMQGAVAKPMMANEQITPVMRARLSAFRGGM